MGLTSTLEWTRPRGAVWKSFVKVLGTPRHEQDSLCAPAETWDLSNDSFSDRGVQPIIFCFWGVPPSGKSLPINLANALR